MSKPLWPFLRVWDYYKKGEGEDVRLPEAASLSGKECDSAKRVREFRARQKEVKALHCNGAVTSGNENVTLELEKELETETETEEANASTCVRARARKNQLNVFKNQR